MIGASIQIKGTTLGTITDYNGQFSLNDVPADGVLTVSYIGFNTEDIPVNHQKNLQIVMRENAEQLEEVVVVAYGTAKKSSFTGSAEVVKQDRIEKRVVADVSKALEGTVAGVQSTSGSGQPGEGASMIIRGFGSISAANTPLYVIMPLLRKPEQIIIVRLVQSFLICGILLRLWHRSIRCMNIIRTVRLI